MVKNHSPLRTKAEGNKSRVDCVDTASRERNEYTGFGHSLHQWLYGKYFKIIQNIWQNW